MSVEHIHQLSFQDFYSPMDIKYLGLKMFDVPQTNIKKFFDTSTKFIETALACGGINMKQYIVNVCYR